MPPGSGGATGVAHAQDFELPEAAVTDSAVLSQAMPSLARALLETYTDSDSVTFLTNLFTIQAVAGRYADSRKTLATLDRRYRSSVPEIRATHVLYAMYAMYAQAMARVSKTHLPS